MTVMTSTNYVVRLADGVNDTFGFPFLVFEAEHLVISLREIATGVTTVVPASGYSITGLGNVAGGSIVLTAVPVVGYQVILARIVSITQPLDIVNQSGFYPATLEEQLDLIVMQIQQIDTEADRGIKVEFPETGFSLPSAVERANRFFSFDASGLPYMSSGTGADSGLRDDIASSTGGAMVGTKQTGSNTATRTDLAKNNDIVSLTDFTGITFDGVTDDSAGVANALADGRKIMIPNGTCVIDTDITSAATTVHLEGTGENSVLDFSGGGSLKLGVTPTAIPDLSVDVTAGGNSFTFASAHGLVEGDVFILYNPTDFSFASYRAEYRDGAMFRVASVPTSTTLVIYGTSPRAFTAANVDCYKMVGGKVVIKGVRIIPPASGIPIQIDGHQGVVLEDITCDEGAADTGIDIWRCFDFSISRVQSTVLNGDAYPVIIANSQAGRISDCQLYSYRHCIGLGGRNDICSVPVRDVIISDCSLYNNGAGGEGASDIHGNCEDIVYSNCIMNSVAKIGGKNVRYEGCTVFGRPPASYADGLCVTGSEIVGGTFELLDCRFVTFGNGSSFGTIYADISGRSEDLTFIVRGCTIVSRGSGAATVRMIMLALGSTAGTFRVDTRIDGLTYVGAAAAQVLNLTGDADISAISSHIVENITAPSGTALLGATTAANYGATVPLRLQKQTGKVTLSAAIDTAQTASGFITFRYPYPRAPQAFATAVGAVNGNRLAHGSLFVLEATRLRAMIESGDQTNWSATADRVVSWSAELAEL